MSSDGIREIGVGMLGYAFMGKAHANAFRKIAYMTWPPPLMPRLVAIAGRNEEAVSEAADALRLRALDDRLAGARRRSRDRALRQPRAQLAARRADDRGGRGGQARRLREAARPRRRRELRDLAARRGDRRQAHVRLQLPLRPRRAPRAGADRGRRARRDPPLPRPLPPGLGRHRPPRSGASTAAAAGSGALGDLATHVVDLARYLVGEIDDGRRLRAHVRPRARGRRRRRGDGRVRRTAPSARSRRRGSRSAAGTRSSGRSTARRARSRSTWSA